MSAVPLPPEPQRCTNCGNEVAQRYCGACGQRAEGTVHSLGHFLHHAFEDLTHADSRVWRTLTALLLRPGYLTAEFLAGRRVRYLPPVRVYLVLSLVFFLWAAASKHPGQVTLEPPSDVARQAASTVAGHPPAATPPSRCETDYDGPGQNWVRPLLLDICRKAAANPHAVSDAFLHNLPRAMFVFLPVFAGVMSLLFWFPRHYYVEHLLLLVHDHACIFLVLMLSWGVGKLLPPAGDWLDLAVMLYLAWYLFRSMRVVYKQGRLLTLLKFAVLAFFYLVGGAVMLG
ncbi:MAG: DUF3667 domain-containing protein, partial [Gammaproteobacteria bacterium]|nr:DUF3667 domain-containing protein [Gammaproteobacteria bacterium]